MRQLYLLIGLLFTVIINGQIINFPDANFKAKLLQPGVAYTYMGDPNYQIDVNGNGEIEVSEAQLVWALDISNSSISDISGISYFTGLKQFQCQNNLLNSLVIDNAIDLQFLNASHNVLTVVDVNMGSDSEGLNLSYNNLTSYIFANGNYYETVDLSHNQLTNLVIGNANFEYFNISYNNLSSIQIGSAYAHFYASFAQNNFTHLDFSEFGFGYQSTIVISQNNIESVIFKDFYQPETIYCSSNSTSLDLGNFHNVSDCEGLHPKVYIIASPNLQNLILRNGFNHTVTTCNEGGFIFDIPAMDLSISNCPNLNHVCVDDGELTSVQNKINILGLQNQVVVDSNCTSLTLGTETFFAADQFVVFPVPASHLLQIQSKENLGIQSIEVYNNLGQLVQKEIGSRQNIDVSQLVKGMYYLKIKTDEGSYAKPFLKQ